MKTITNLNSVLAFQLEGIYEIIKNLQTAVPLVVKSTTDKSMQDLLRGYADDLAEQRLKLKRMFGYILSGPYQRKSGTIADAIIPFKEIAERNAEDSLRNILVITSMQAAIQFMITSYTDARYMAMRLELDTVVRLLDDTLTIEEAFLRRLRSFSAVQINNACLLTSVN
jgi:ferritin-like metal-binding protein YciE